MDLFVGYADRADGCFAVILLDDEHRCVQPVLIAEMGIANPAELRHHIAMLLEQVRPPAIVTALGRPGSPLFTDNDRAVHQTLVELCRDAGVDLVGAFVATEHTVRELPDHLRMAS